MKIYVDAAFIDKAKGQVVYTALIQKDNQKSYYYYIPSHRVYDNNMAEYDAVYVFQGYFLTHSLSFEIHTDSQDAIRRMEKLPELITHDIAYEHVPRMLNPLNMYTHMIVQELRSKKRLPTNVVIIKELT